MTAIATKDTAAVITKHIDDESTIDAVHLEVCGVLYCGSRRAPDDFRLCVPLAIGNVGESTRPR